MRPIPRPDAVTSLRSLQAMLREGHPLAALQVFHHSLGDVFQVQLPGFAPVMLGGPEGARFVLVQRRDELLWRNENDPVTDLLRHGVLVEDGEEHAYLRQLLNPALHRKMLSGYLAEMWTAVERVTSAWQDGEVVDLLVEMRKIALLILTQTLFRVDFFPQLKPLWGSILGCIGYISPGIWMFWPQAPRPGYRRAIQQMDEYLYRIIAERRRLLEGEIDAPQDILGILLQAGMPDALTRDQLLTMLIAGHDTVTALMSWCFYLLGRHPATLALVQAEAQNWLAEAEFPELEGITRMTLLEQVIKEALRLYPPIHLGSRLAATDLEYQGYRIPKDTRVVYSIYLTQRHPAYWAAPDRFLPERFAPGNPQIPYSWLAFGGGPRNCIGAAFGQIEARLVLAQILACFKLTWMDHTIHPHMGATLEPRPGVRMRVERLRQACAQRIRP